MLKKNKMLGVDVNRKWQFADGDLILIDDINNLYQAIYNRITCTLDDMSYFYSNYGSRVREWLGKINTTPVLNDLELEVETRILDDPRVTDCDVTCVKLSPYVVAIHTETKTNTKRELIYNFVFDSISNQLEYVGGRVTGMTLHIGEWSCPFHTESQKYIRRGELFTLHCRIATKGHPVPIGSVDFSYGDVVFMHKEVERGVADIQYTFPKYISEGEYTIHAHYNGIGKFESSDAYIKVIVVDKYHTTTKLRQNNIYTYVGQDRVNFPTTVKDILGGYVNDGHVDYLLKMDGLFRISTKLDIHNWDIPIDPNPKDPLNLKSSPRAVFSFANITDRLNNPVTDGYINFYIENGDGFYEASKTVLDNSYGLDDLMNASFFHAKVTDMHGKELDSGYVDFSYRKPEYLNTTTILPDVTRMYHGIDNMVSSEVIDEDNIGVTDGNVEYYIRRCNRCKPYLSKINAQNAYIRNSEALLRSRVTDEDDIAVKSGSVTYDFSDVPIALKTNSNLKETKDKIVGAVLMDSDGVIIDAGKITTQKTDDGIDVTSYVSDKNTDVDDDNNIYFELMKD